MSTEVELQRRLQDGSLTGWEVADDENSPTGVAEPSMDVEARQRLSEAVTELQAVVAALGGTLQVAGEVDVDAVDVGNFPADYPDAVTQQRLDDVNTALANLQLELQAKVDDGGNVVVQNLPTDYPLPASQLSLLEPKDQVDVGNFPTTYPDGHDQPLTDAQLRAAPPQVDTGLTVQTDALTDEELRAAPVGVDTGLNQPAEASDLSPLAKDTTVEQVRDRLAPTLPADSESGLPERLHVQHLAALPSGGNSIGFVSSSGVLESVFGHSFAAGTNVLSTTNNITVLLSNPAESGKVVVIGSFVVSHDEGNTLVPVEVIRQPSTNLPTALIDSMNLNIGGDLADDAVVEVYEGTGSAMGGGEESIWLPTTGNVPVAFSLTDTPALVWPGADVGLNFDIGATLSSGDGMVAILWIERDEQDILDLLAYHGMLPEE